MLLIGHVEMVERHGAAKKCILRVWTRQAIALASLLAAVPVFAASQSDYDDCAQNSDQDRQIAGCTQIIDDIGESIHNRRLAFDNRGTARHAKGYNDRAIADYTEAIKLNPKDALAYDNRGTAWRDKGDLDRALADYNTAIKLNPTNAVAHGNRGNLQRERGDNRKALADYTEALRLDPHFALAYANRALVWHLQGDNARAIADSTEAIQLDPNEATAYRIRGYAYFGNGDFAAAAADLLRASNLAVDAYGAIWLFLARSRAGENGTVELVVNATRSRVKGWPGPVIDLYLGRRAFEEVRAAAANPVQLCEVDFYGGEWHLLRGNEHDARTKLEAATRICAKSSKEHNAATVELKRLSR
jgi:tetratricopeptide (TPR) repeat protein